MKKLLVFAACAASCWAAGATDLGVQGTTFPIVEVDMRELFRRELEKADVKKIQREMKESATHWLDNLPKHALPTLDKTFTKAEILEDSSPLSTSDR